METTSRTLNRSLRLSPVQRVRRAAGTVTPLAWVLGGLTAAALVVGRWTGWEELAAVAVAGLALFGIGAVFMLGRVDLDVDVDVRPQRVMAGERAVAAVTAANRGGGRVLGASMELVVGDGAAEWRLPALAHGDEHEELFVLPTVRRAVIPVGPASTVRGDPLGLFRRTSSWTDVVPLFVHPVTTPLPELGTGFIRDLEGRATNAVSQSDVAFNTLREYEPGDDRRLIHWLTTARVGELMVRQFIDTRRSHVALVVDGARSSYETEDEFELAVSVAASIGRRVLLDEQEASMVVAGDRIPTSSGMAMLDGLAAVQPGHGPARLVSEIDRLFRYAGGFSLAVLVTGSRTPIADLRAAAVRFPSDVRVFLLQVDPEATTSFRPLGSQALLTLAHLDDLASLLWAAMS